MSGGGMIQAVNIDLMIRPYCFNIWAKNVKDLRQHLVLCTCLNIGYIWMMFDLEACILSCAQVCNYYIIKQISYCRNSPFFISHRDESQFWSKLSHFTVYCQNNVYHQNIKILILNLLINILNIFYPEPVDSISY